MTGNEETSGTAPSVIGANDSAAKSQEMLEHLCAVEHPECLFCGKANPIGFGLSFQVVRPGVVRAAFPGGRLFQSYAETLHGGVTSALLDAAMTNALFSLGVVAVTGELTVRYLNPIELGRPAQVVARLEQNTRPLYTLSAELHQSGRVAARASAKFVDKAWAASGPLSTAR